jgi:hypothetical protein
MVAWKLPVLCTKYIVTSIKPKNILKNFWSWNWPEFVLLEKVWWGTKLVMRSLSLYIMKEISHNWHIPYYRMPSSGTVIPLCLNNNLMSFCLCRMHKLIPVLQSAVEFLYKLLPPTYQPFFPAPCSHWFLNLLICTEHHSIHEQSAQKQQHGTVSHSCSVVVKFAVTSVNHFESLNFKEFLCVVLL